MMMRRRRLMIDRYQAQDEVNHRARVEARNTEK
jgi:hypothetical protein